MEKRQNSGRTEVKGGIVAESRQNSGRMRAEWEGGMRMKMGRKTAEERQSVFENDRGRSPFQSPATPSSPAIVSREAAKPRCWWLVGDARHGLAEALKVGKVVRRPLILLGNDCENTPVQEGEIGRSPQQHMAPVQGDGKGAVA